MFDGNSGEIDFGSSCHDCRVIVESTAENFKIIRFRAGVLSKFASISGSVGFANFKRDEA